MNKEFEELKKAFQRHDTKKKDSEREILVKNVNKSSTSKCSCGTWMKHWEYYTKRTTHLCAVAGCKQDVSAGAHVQKKNSSDKSWYIVPLCSYHNKSQNELTIEETLVPADKLETCYK